MVGIELVEIVVGIDIELVVEIVVGIDIELVEIFAEMLAVMLIFLIRWKWLNFN